MACCEVTALSRMRGLILVIAGFGGLAILPSPSIAQYPGSAGDLNAGAFSGSTSTDSGQNSGLTNSSSANETHQAPNAAPSASSVNDSGAGYGASAIGNASGDPDIYREQNFNTLQASKATRKRALIRQFRLEFAKTLTIETVNQRPLWVLSADRYLDQFSQELDAGLDRKADLKSLGQDLAVVRDALDGRLEVVISSYNGGQIKQEALFARKSPANSSVAALRAEINQLVLKHELLEFGEYSLRAMGYYAE